jgi:hypothetical protein
MDKHLIFLHIPKNGGTTFSRLLGNLYPKERIFSIEVINEIRLNTEDFINLPEEARRNIKVLGGHMEFGLHRYFCGPSEYITFLRKPLNRVMSYYHYVLSNPRHRLYERVKRMTLHDFVQNIDQSDVNNAQVRWISGIDGAEDMMLAKALDNINQYFPIVGLLEHFDESLVLLKKRHNWRTIHYRRYREGYYRRYNEGERRPTDGVLDQKTIDLIVSLNKGDYELYSEMKRRLEQQMKRLGKMELKLELAKLKLLNRCMAFVPR